MLKNLESLYYLEMPEFRVCCSICCSRMCMCEKASTEHQHAVDRHSGNFFARNGILQIALSQQLFKYALEEPPDQVG